MILQGRSFRRRSPVLCGAKCHAIRGVADPAEGPAPCAGRTLQGVLWGASFAGWRPTPVAGRRLAGKGQYHTELDRRQAGSRASRTRLGRCALRLHCAGHQPLHSWRKGARVGRCPRREGRGASSSWGAARVVEDRWATSAVGCVRRVVGELSAKPAMKRGQEAQIGCREGDLSAIGEICIFYGDSVRPLGKVTDARHVAPVQ